MSPEQIALLQAGAGIATTIGVLIASVLAILTLRRNKRNRESNTKALRIRMLIELHDFEELISSKIKYAKDNQVPAGDTIKIPEWHQTVIKNVKEMMRDVSYLTSEERVYLFVLFRTLSSGSFKYQYKAIMVSELKDLLDAVNGLIIIMNKT